MKHYHLPKEVDYILTKINQHGYEAYPVGGCVRDLLLFLSPKDWDIATNASPEIIIAIFRDDKKITDYARHGTVSVILNEIAYEITTYRIEGIYSDFRHPDNVMFTNQLFHDLSRRDFTINALALDRDKVIDYFGGLNDIQQKLIRCVGDPTSRFREDPLRILRALRFSSVLQFEIEEKTASALFAELSSIHKVSVERVSNELNQILMGKNCVSTLAYYSEVIFSLMPELKKMSGFDQMNHHHVYDVWTHTLQALENTPDVLILRIAVLFHDAGKPDSFTIDGSGVGHFYGHPELSAQIARTVLERLHYSKKIIDTTVSLIRYHDAALLPNSISIKQLLYKVGKEEFEQLLLIKKADILAQNPDYRNTNLSYLDQIRNVYNDIINRNECYSLSQLSISGRDLMQLGIPEGSRIGEMLDILLRMVIQNEIPNEKNALIQTVCSMIKNN